ncbi:MAG: hypothetical protein ACFFD4_18045 [Candidatus Odinarchaeota archaeon]
MEKSVQKRRLLMAGMTESLSNERHQVIIFVMLSFVMAGFAEAVYLTAPQLFQAYFGTANPLLMVVILALLGTALSVYFLSSGRFELFNGEKHNLRGLVPYFGLAVLLAVLMITVDSIFMFPESISVLFPQSVLFYPVMGFVAEIVFHLIPLSLVLIISTLFSGKVDFSKIFWPSILIISALEPIFQIWDLFGYFPPWAAAYVGIHIYVINIIGLSLFKRRDFLSMYSFRLVYYLFWHIAWGYLRLGILF